MNSLNDNPQIKLIFTFGFAIAALFMLIVASQVAMPLRAILIALALSDILFLLFILLGDKFLGGRK